MSEEVGGIANSVRGTGPPPKGRSLLSHELSPLPSSARSRPELLAPAGGPDAGYAALTYGADAVYLGLRQFSARAEAENFSLEELDAFAAYARSLAPSRRVYAAVNTLVLEREVPSLVATLAALRDLAVDAVIVQDLGVARLVRRHFPDLELHASTQMAVHSRSGVDALARLGVRRAVVARELTLEEIADVSRQGEVEIECFVHGAACYSYSGLCLFSSHALGRSANRGRCAYVCGGSFAAEDGGAGRRTANPFAMKDLALPGRLSDLAAAGVASLKIEGRKKSPLYVAAVTDFYRSLLDAALDPEERRRREGDLQTVFSRPWTELYLGGPRQASCADPRWVGHRGAPVGSVTAVRGGRQRGATLRFTTRRPLELHDGLQVDIPGRARPYGFSVDGLRAAGASAPRFEVVPPPGGEVEVEVALPPDHPAIPVGAAVHCSSSQAVKRAFRWARPREGEFRRRRPLQAAVRVAADRVEVRVRVAEGEPLETVQALEGRFEAARDPGAAAQGALAAFERLGNSPFALRELTVDNPGGLYVAPSQWNRLRRSAAEALEEALTSARGAEVAAIVAGLGGEDGGAARAAAATPRWSLKLEGLAQTAAFSAADWEGVDEVVWCLGSGEDAEGGLGELSARVGRDRVRLALPPVVRAWDEARLRTRVAKLLAEGWQRWEVSNLAGWGHLGLAPGETGGLDLSADWPLYVTNAQAGRELLGLGVGALTLSPEDGAENLASLLAAFGAAATVVVYQHTPLFVSETCPRATLSGRCPGPGRCDFERLDLVSDFGDRVRALRRACRTVVVARAAFCLSEALAELTGAGAASFRVDLQYGDEAPEAARDACRLVRAGRSVPGSHPGNYRRGLL